MHVSREESNGSVIRFWKTCRRLVQAHDGPPKGISVEDWISIQATASRPLLWRSMGPGRKGPVRVFIGISMQEDGWYVDRTSGEDQMVRLGKTCWECKPSPSDDRIGS